MTRRVSAWLIVIVGTLVCRAMYLEDVIYNIDEAEYAVAADALGQGWLPGVDLLGSTKPPGIVGLCRLLFEMCGRSFAALHIAQLLLTLIAGVLTVEIAITLLGLAAALPTALGFWLIANGFSLPEELLSFSVEAPGLVFVLLAIWLALTRRRDGWWVAAGASFGLALLFRQSFLPFAIPLVWAIDAKAGRGRAAIMLLAGVALVWTPVLGAYAARGALAWCWDSWVRYPLTYAGDLGLAGFLNAFFLNLRDLIKDAPVPVAGAVFGAISLWRERQSTAAKWLLGFAAASMIAVSAGSRFYGHYFIQTFAAFAFLTAYAALGYWRRGGAWKAAVIAMLAVGGVMSALHFPRWYAEHPGAPPRGISFYALGREQLERQLGAYANEQTGADETIFVWGYCPQIYFYARRLPGVRDYLCHYVTGFSASAFDPHTQKAPRASGHPHAVDLMLEDLERRRPRLIFDLVQVTDYEFTFYQYSLHDYPALRDYLTQHYEPDRAIGAALVYRRRGG